MNQSSFKNICRLFILILIITGSCSKPDFEFDKIKLDNLNSEWGLPLVKSTLTLEDFLSDTGNIIQTHDDGLVTLVYESKNIVSKEAWERTQIPDQHKILNQSFDMPALPFGFDTTLPLAYQFTFDLENQGQRIDSLILTSGMYNLKLSTNLNKDFFAVKLMIPNIISRWTGDTLTFSFDLSNPQGNEINIDTTIDLAAYYVQFDNSVQQNTVDINALVGISSDDNIDLSPYHINLENTITSLNYSQFYGYIGEHTESYEDTIDLNLYHSADIGNITFGAECVNMKIEIENELGLPLQIEAEKFTAYHTGGSNPDSVDVYLFGQGNPNIFTINSPAEVGDGVLTTIEVNEANISDALNISPNKIFFKLNGNFNYEGDNQTTNFFSDTSILQIYARLSLDLYGNISSFKIADTLDFSLDPVDNLKAVELKLGITNGFPIEATALVDFLDDENQLLYSLFSDDADIIVSAETGDPPECKVINPARKETTILIDGDAMESVLKATQVVFMSTLSTEPGKLVKIYSDYNIDLELSAKLYVNF